MNPHWGYEAAFATLPADQRTPLSSSKTRGRSLLSETSLPQITRIRRTLYIRDSIPKGAQLTIYFLRYILT